MNSSYLAKKSEVKKEKRKVSKEYEECYNNYLKLKQELETTLKNLDVALADYQQSIKKKEEDSSILKQEMKARLLKTQAETLKNKIISSKDKVLELKKKVVEENIKISSFNNEQNDERIKLCNSALISIMIELERSLQDQMRAFEALINYKESSILLNEPSSSKSQVVLPHENYYLKNEGNWEKILKEVNFVIEKNSSDFD